MRPFLKKNLRNVEPLQVKNLLAYYKEGCKKPEDVAIGMEVEKHGIFQANNKPITYFGANGLLKIQEKMIEELGWKISKQEENYLLRLKRCGSFLTLETAQSMSELSGRTHQSIHSLARELDIHQHEFSVISKIFGVLWLGIGIQPFASNDVIKLLETPRYKMLRNYLKSQGGLWQEELKKTASVQANIDFVSEIDACKKFQTLLRLSPFLGAMYAHSPLNKGKLSGYVSYRMHVLNNNDPKRFGIRKFFFENDFSLKDWVNFCLDIQMIAVKRGGKMLNINAITFRQFIEKGYKDFYPTIEDWVMHTSMIYSFVRIKRYIELRICDSVPSFLIPSIQAIVKAFVYHPDGGRILKDITKKWSFTDFSDSYEAIAKNGMDAVVCGNKILSYCKEILNVATDNLRSFKIFNERKFDESVYLIPIKDFVFVKEKSPGAHVAELWQTEWAENPERLVEWCRHD